MVNGDTSFSEIAAGLFGLLLVGTFIACAVLSVIFLLKRREKKWRTAPSLMLIALPIISLVPEEGVSDVNAHWHYPLLLLPWSLMMLWMAAFFFKKEMTWIGLYLRLGFGVLGTVMFFGSICGLAESIEYLNRLKFR